MHFEIKITPSKPQYDIITSTQPVNLFLAGQGSGKSHCAGILAAMYVSSFPEQRGIICANTYSQLNKSTLFRIREVWKEFFGMTEYSEANRKGCYTIGRKPPAHFNTTAHNYEQYEHIICFENGAVIYAGSLDNYKALDGMEACWAILDETKDTREEAVKEVITGRLRQKGLYIDEHDNLIASAMANAQCRSFNPLYIFTSPAKVPWINDWFCLNEFEAEINQLIFSETTYFSKKISNKFVTISSTWHNRNNLPASYIDNQKANLPTSLQDMLIYGSPFSKAGGEFYKHFDRSRHVVNLCSTFPQWFGAGTIPYNPQWPLILSFDENVIPYLPVGIYQMKDLWLFKIDEISATPPGNTVDAVCAEVIRRYPGHTAGMDIWGDATSQKEDVKLEKGFNFYRIIITKLAQFRPRLRVGKANPSVAGRGDFINTVLEKEIYGCRFFIDQGCTHTIADYTMTREAPDRSKEKKPVKDPLSGRTYQPYGHHTDEGDYVMCGAWAAQYLNYQKGERSAPPLYSIGRYKS